jgi:hypothetical protein
MSRQYTWFLAVKPGTYTCRVVCEALGGTYEEQVGDGGALCEAEVWDGDEQVHAFLVTCPSVEFRDRMKAARTNMGLDFGICVREGGSHNRIRVVTNIPGIGVRRLSKKAREAASGLRSA